MSIAAGSGRVSRTVTAATRSFLSQRLTTSVGLPSRRYTALLIRLGAEHPATTVVEPTISANAATRRVLLRRGPRPWRRMANTARQGNGQHAGRRFHVT